MQPQSPATEQWFATIADHPHLSTTFWMAAGATPGQARMQAWIGWSHARAYGSDDRNAPVAAQGLIVRLAAARRLAA